MYQKITLENGLRIATETMPQTHSVCLSFFIGAGSRYEDSEKAGLSHFTEHLCFKGTQQRATAKEISETIEGVGGFLNGATDREISIYWAKVARPHFALALDLLVDMLRHSRFDPVDIEKERNIIIEELNTSLDVPSERVNMLIDELIWPNQPLGRYIVGTKETISAISRQMLLDYLSSQYIPNNTVVSVAGDISHEEVVASLSKAIRDWTGGMPGSWHPAKDDQNRPRLAIEPSKTEQVHLCLAVRGYSRFHPDRFTLDLLNVILGEGMSSRLFLNIREKLGLAYDVHSFVSHFLDSGSLTIYAGVDPARTAAAVEAILQELHRLKEMRSPELELTKAKELSKGRMLLRMEDTGNVALWMGGQELLMKRIRTVDEIASIIDAITAEDIQRVAQNLFVTKKLNMAVVGPVHNQKGLKALLKL